MALDRTWYNTLVDDDGSNTVGSVWDKADVDALMDAVDAELVRTITPPIHCSVSRSVGAGQSVPHATWTALSYDVVHTQTPAGMFTPGTGHLIAPSAGIYLVTASACFAINTTGARAATIYLNGSPTLGRAGQDHMIDANSSTYSVCTSTAVLALQAGQYVQFLAYHAAGAPLQVGGFGTMATNALQLTRIAPLT